MEGSNYSKRSLCFFNSLVSNMVFEFGVCPILCKHVMEIIYGRGTNCLVYSLWLLLLEIFNERGHISIFSTNNICSLYFLCNSIEYLLELDSCLNTSSIFSHIIYISWVLFFFPTKLHYSEKAKNKGSEHVIFLPIIIF